MEEVLSRIENGTTIRSIVGELDLNRSTLLAMIEFMVDEQYLERVDLQCSCSTSNLCEQCQCNGAGTDHGTAMYALTPKGLRFISNSVNENVKGNRVP
jgi:predicted transcriptional regulator